MRMQSLWRNKLGRARILVAVSSSPSIITPSQGTKLWEELGHSIRQYDYCRNLPLTATGGGERGKASASLPLNSVELANIRFKTWTLTRGPRCNIREFKQWRRRRQQERQKSNRFRLAKQQLCTCSTLFYTFLSLRSRLQRESASFQVLSKTGTQDNIFLFFSWTLIQSFRIQLQNNLPAFDELNAME